MTLAPCLFLKRACTEHHFFGGIMSNELYRAERCRDLAEEYRRIAAMCTSTEMRSHYSRMSEHYRTLAKTDEFGVETAGPA
jgi:hypothetical protein